MEVETPEVEDPPIHQSESMVDESHILYAAKPRLAPSMNVTQCPETANILVG